MAVTVPNDNNSNASKYGTTQEPIVDPETLKFRRAITRDSQVADIRQRLINDNKERTKKNAQISRKYNDEQPFDRAKMKAAQQSWRNNRATGFLSGFIKRVVPAYKKMIDNAQSLTSAKLEDETPQGEEMGQTFRTEITRTIRQWYGWSDFCERLIVEDVLYGYAAACFPDEYSWKPLLGRQDEAMFPNGQSQYVRETNLWCFDQNMFPHELADKLIEPEISEAAGWFPKNIVESINHARPDDRVFGKDEDYRKYEDTVRESTIGASFTTDVKQVEASHIFAVEVTGKVSHYIVDTNSKDILYKKLDKFEDVEDALSLFAIEVGNGNLHGSKGLGRVLYNSHVAVERSRNLVADNLYLSTLLLIKGKPSAKNQMAITINHPICVINDDVILQQEKFQVDTEAFFQLDQHITQLAELMAGAFMPSVGNTKNDSGGGKKTAAEINYVASIEQALREGVLARFYGQFQIMISTMQRRICSADNIRRAREILELRKKQNGIVRRAFLAVLDILSPGFSDQFQAEDPGSFEDQDAVDCVVRMLNKGMSVRQVVELALCPAQFVNTQDAQSRDQAIDYVQQKYKGDPDIDQIELKKRDIGSKLGTAAADDLVVAANDPTQEIEQVQKQIGENDSLLQGETIPVSPRDNDLIHLRTMMEKFEPLLKQATPEMITEETMPIYQAMAEHARAHVDAAKQEGVDAEQINPFDELTSMLEEMTGQGPKAPTDGTLPADVGDAANAQGEITPLEEQPAIASIDNPGMAAANKPLSKGPTEIIPTPPS